MATSDWIKWNGGDCPVEADTLVNWRFVDRNDNDDELSREAGKLDWSHGAGDEGNIIAYRVVSA